MDCCKQRLAEPRLRDLCVGLVVPRYRNVSSSRYSDLIRSIGGRTRVFMELRKDSQLVRENTLAQQLGIGDLTLLTPARGQDF